VFFLVMEKRKTMRVKRAFVAFGMVAAILGALAVKAGPDAPGNAQDLTNALGSILRIEPRAGSMGSFGDG
jgi:hypothetical protein